MWTGGDVPDLTNSDDVFGFVPKQVWGKRGRINKSSGLMIHLSHQYGDSLDILRYETSPYQDVKWRTESFSKP